MIERRERRREEGAEGEWGMQNEVIIRSKKRGNRRRIIKSKYPLADSPVPQAHIVLPREEQK